MHSFECVIFSNGTTKILTIWNSSRMGPDLSFLITGHLKQDDNKLIFYVIVKYRMHC